MPPLPATPPQTTTGGTLSDAWPERKRSVPTGCAALDLLLSGGLEKGVVTEIVGGAGCGKTTLGIMLAASCILNTDESSGGGGFAAFIDTEGGLSIERTSQVLKSRGVAESRIPIFLKRILVRRAHDFAEQGETLRKLAHESPRIRISAIIVDSVTSNYRIERTSENFSDLNRELAAQLRILSTIAIRRDIPVIVTNQEYLDFKTKAPANVAGDVLKYIPKTIIRLSRSSGILQFPRPGLRTASIIKHRFLPEGTSLRLLLSDEGFVSSPLSLMMVKKKKTTR